MKSVEFLGSSLDDLRSFPASVMREAGYQIDRIQNGLLPDDFKPMTSVGSAVAEIRIWDEAGTFRVIYVAKFENAVYVLHCFNKKSQKTTKKDIDLAAKRYKDLIKEIAS
jgi:phage-related protein